ncbi:hypothetical protein MJG53_013088 [Ovis ammon polii x Ovis aries]|uniref:Uncharacterized protein n=1 Tax=Ovis ammon polii x Ovis aries TaxID=2918886 RepID=A0ACB9UIH1_9CETA|nr:hypothetical protein MJG53_013088 [Ovis ammon polii x Ovis aries]
MLENYALISSLASCVVLWLALFGVRSRIPDADLHRPSLTLTLPWIQVRCLEEPAELFISLEIPDHGDTHLKRQEIELPGGSVVKNLPANAGDPGFTLLQENSHAEEQRNPCAAPAEPTRPRARASQREVDCGEEQPRFGAT